MSIEDRIRAQEAARAARRATEADPQPDTTPPLPAAPTVRTRKVRRTVDLPSARHAQFDQWCADTAIQLGVARVTGQDALNTLVHLVLTDELMARRVRADIAEQLRIREHAKQAARAD